MVIMCVPLLKLLHQVATGYIQYLSTYYQVRVGAYGHVLSCQAFNTTTSRGPNSGGAYPVLKAPRCCCWEPGYDLSRGEETDGVDRW
jgi:hypothetical protein